MDIKQLQPKQGNVDIILDVAEVGDVRDFQKFGKSGRVATAQAKDESGDIIKLTLWNEDIERIKAGDKVHLVNGYVSEWQGELQLTTGRFGKLEVIKAGSEEEGEKVYRNYPPEEEDMLLDKAPDKAPDTDEENIEEI